MRILRPVLCALAAVLVFAGVYSLVANRLAAPESPPPSPVPPGYAVLPDAGGRPALVACTANSARRAALRNVAAINHIVTALQRESRVCILTNDRDAFSVLSNPSPERVRFLDLPSELAFTIWPQDPFVVLEHDDLAHPPVYLVPRQFTRADDRRLADLLAAETSATCITSDLVFEGGNIVADRDFVFIGANTILQNADLLGESAAEITRRFEAELGRQAMVIGPAPQPVGHIDLVLAPLGGRRVALADPAWGARLVRDLMARDPDIVIAFEQECIDGFFGRKGIKELFDKDGQPIAPPDILGHTQSAATHCAGLAADFDALAADLEDIGYEVLRIPFLGPSPDADDPSRADAPDGEDPPPGPRFPTLTYNNVLLSGRDAVFLARYGLDVLDDAAAEAWRAAGFEVRPVNGMTTSAMYGGSLRCCVKVLERSSTSARND